MAASVAIGEVIAGKYRVTGVVGEGGMGVVLAADHLQLLQPVAIKLLHPGAAPQTIQRFFREARAAAQIPSEHVARVMDVDLLPTGEPYLVMELLEGMDLAALLERSGPLPVGDAVGYLLQACEAVGKAHERGIVHRDLKPGNLFLTHRVDGSPRIKVLDFGISKLREEDRSGGRGGPLTATGDVLGSPLYMAPEQWVSATEADARSDVWSLGAILYELLTGRPPFDGEGFAQICRAVLDADPAAMRDQRAELPPEIEAAVLQCLVKDRERRTASVADLGQALAPFAWRRQDAAAEHPPQPTPTATMPSAQQRPAPTPSAPAAASPTVQAQPAQHVPATAAIPPQRPPVPLPDAGYATTARTSSRRGLWIGLAVAGLVAVLTITLVLAFAIGKRRVSKRGGAKRRAVPSKVTKKPTKKFGHQVKPEERGAHDRWEPHLDHAVEIVGHCHDKLGNPPEALFIAVNVQAVSLEAVDPKNPNQQLACAFAQGGSEVQPPKPLTAKERRNAFPFRRVDLTLVKRLTRDAARRAPGKGTAQQVVFRRIRDGLHWQVFLGKQWRGSWDPVIWYDPRGKYLSGA
ncbi:MAG: serine/threonine protein kinase [Deltaproteobacteria bacterium]|jgi:serine/threonine-protein kinase|nr:serine/threonine protein kinase [Deltaproteobacteria bacterium]MBW2531707.1 serine/threonine protein kinase [Deltaproteobacteria bacterium]